MNQGVVATFRSCYLRQTFIKTTIGLDSNLSDWTKKNNVKSSD